ncbi:MAG: tetratricopeptide repeat protein, partial [Planctomycetes bacterium]|nr:tetratricopeptide repeat protein [Planctomycetota bacterium]
GAILCEILTGAPPYARDSSTEALLAASKAWTDKAFAALDACGADARLIDLAQRSLAADPALRPVDGKAFADELADWTQRVHEERRAWEIEAATERHRRRWAWIAALILIAGAIGVSGIWLRAQREHDARLADDRKLAATMAERARVLVQHEWTADAPDPRAWDESIDLAARAQEFSRHRTLGLAIDAELEDLMVRLRRGQDVARTHSDLLKRLTMNCERFGDQTFARQKDREFADIFREVRIEPGITSASAAVAILTAHPCRTALVGALDDWARIRRRAQGKSSELAILELLARVDQDDRRREVRAAMNDAGIERLSGLVHDPAWQDAPAASLLLLANSLRSRDRSDLAKLVLERAQIRFPDQYTVHHELGSMARDATPPQPDEARLHFSMALAARPEDPHALIDLAQVMLQLAEWDRAAAILRRAQHLDPGYAPARHYLGVLAYRLGRPDEAVRELRASLDIDPEPIHTRTVLAMSLLELERGDEAVDELRRVVAGHPEAVESWSILGSALVRQGQFVAAEAALRSGQSADLARGGLLKQPFDGALADLRRHAEAAERLDQIDPRSPPPVGPDQLVVLARTAWFVKRVDLAAQLTQSAIDR